MTSLIMTYQAKPESRVNSIAIRVLHTSSCSAVCSKVSVDLPYGWVAGSQVTAEQSPRFLIVVSWWV